MKSFSVIIFFMLSFPCCNFVNKESQSADHDSSFVNNVISHTMYKLEIKNKKIDSVIKIVADTIKMNAQNNIREKSAKSIINWNVVEMVVKKNEDSLIYLQLTALPDMNFDLSKYYGCFFVKDITFLVEIQDDDKMIYDKIFLKDNMVTIPKEKESFTTIIENPDWLFRYNIKNSQIGRLNSWNMEFL